jgi:hypothetical protein
VRKGLAAAAALAAIASLSLLAACSNKPPAISRVYAKVMYQHDTSTGADSEALSVFLVASDPDGMENLSSFYVINDDAQLFWKVDSSSWVSSTAEAEAWIGSNTLFMPASTQVPAGSYRVLLENSGGDTVEQTFSIAPREIAAAQAAYPSASVADGAIQVSGPYDSVEIWTYGKDGKFAASFPVSRKGPALEVAKMAAASPILAQGFTFRAYANNTRGGFGVLAGPYTAGPIAVGPTQSLPAR